MVHAQSASPRHPIFTALFGMMVLTLGMGVGRFLYTPMLPVMLAEKQLTFNQLSWIASANYAGYLAGSLLFSFGLFHLLSSTPHAAGFGGRHRYSYSGHGDIYPTRGRHVGALPGRRRERGNDDFWINDCVASYPPSVCDRRALFRRRGRDCTGQRICHWRFTLCAFGPFAMAGGRGARRYIAINRGNIDSPALMRCRLRP